MSTVPSAEPARSLLCEILCYVLLQFRGSGRPAPRQIAANQIEEHDCMAGSLVGTCTPTVNKTDNIQVSHRKHKFVRKTKNVCTVHSWRTPAGLDGGAGARSEDQPTNRQPSTFCFAAQTMKLTLPRCPQDVVSLLPAVVRQNAGTDGARQTWLLLLFVVALCCLLLFVVVCCCLLFFFVRPKLRFYLCGG